MKIRTVNRRISLAVSVCLSLFACDESSQTRGVSLDEERAVVKLALEHFAAKMENESGPPGGIILIDPMVERSKFDGVVQGPFEQEDCKIPARLREKVVRRNVAQRRSSELVDDGPAWRIATPIELEKMGQISKDDEIRKMKTLMSFLSPGFASDGTSAAVYVSFTVGIHGASGRYLLVRDENSWRIKCSAFVYYM